MKQGKDSGYRIQRYLRPLEKVIGTGIGRIEGKNENNQQQNGDIES
jgi:hypothetical protein